MEKRLLGDVLEVSEVGLGCMGLSHANGAPTDEQEAIELLHEALKAGYTFFDTAETYGFKEDIHHNEKLLGKAFEGIRQQVVIATKFGVSFDYEENKDHPKLIVDSRPETIRNSIEGSLKRLKTDYIDLYYQHRIDPNVSPEEVATVMKELIEEGKIKAWGVSMADEEYIRRAHQICPISASQNVYSLLSHDESLFDTLEELNIALVSCCPIAKGVSTGQYKKGQKFEKGDYRNYSAWFSNETMDKNQPLLDLLYRLSKEKNATPGQLSLAWMMSKKPWIIPIPGTRKLDRLYENAHAANIVLNEQEIAEIDSVLSQIENK